MKKKRKVNELEEDHDDDELISMNIEGTSSSTQKSTPEVGGNSYSAFKEDDEIEIGRAHV